MTGNLVGGGTRRVVDTVLDRRPGRLDIVNPQAETVETLVDAAGGREELPRMRLLTDETVLKDVFADFLVASRAADLIEADRLALRTGGDLPSGALFVTDDSVVSLLDLLAEPYGIVSDDADLVSATRGAFDERWQRAPEYNLRTPGLSRLRETLSADLGPEVERDFTATLEAVGSVTGDDGLDEVALSLLVAAKHRELLYDISKWGEDVGLASKATFSRTKSRLEARGLVDTEKVPIDVGRPRLRLTLADEALAEGPLTDLTSAARRALS